MYSDHGVALFQAMQDNQDDSVRKTQIFFGWRPCPWWGPQSFLVVSLEYLWDWSSCYAYTLPAKSETSVQNHLLVSRMSFDISSKRPFFEETLVVHTVDGTNPAPPGMYKTLQLVNNGKNTNLNRLAGFLSINSNTPLKSNIDTQNSRHVWKEIHFPNHFFVYLC